ncbi:unnamed protein product [Arctia plantaginis]|uniref:alpha-glucosidase n=1 Tax=Arctia plantaginis TaxID=874455 RepID=A0A8S1A8B4_ARCPL|nr:unnamed protein product [Arctia plantaginis]
MKNSVLWLMTLLPLILVSVSGAAWWKSTVVYQIYPRSFKDSNGDGIGDLNGITEKLQYIKNTGIDAIWLSPIFKSPMYDFGYDIADYRVIAKEYGTMEDFDNLMKEAKSLGIRVILDYVPNHTSNESEWFVKSVQKDPEYVDYYIWADGKPDPENPDKLIPPSNWVSVFRKSAWEYNEVRKQYYLHQFLIGQPDLNFRNEKVREEMKDVLRFWLDKGVSGFRMDAINMMFEVDPADFKGFYPDEPLSGVAGATPDDYEYLNHIYTRDLDELYNVIYDWRAVLDEYRKKESKIMMTEAYTDLKRMMRYYGNADRKGSVPFNFIFLDELKKGSNARDIKLIVDKWMTYMPLGKTANWVNGNHDQSRLASRHGDKRVDALNMLALILPGITITYQGEELGMTDGKVSWEETKDPQACNTDDPVNYWKKSRDPARTPFHWDATSNAGFSSGDTTWLPVADNYRTLNLATQKKAAKSHYKFYKDMVGVKHLPAVRFGDLQIHALSDSILAVIRLVPGEHVVAGVINLSDETHAINLSPLRLLPNELQVVASGVDCCMDKGSRVQKTSIKVSGHCAIAFESVKKCC